MNLIEKVKNNDEIIIRSANLNEIIEDDQVQDWLQISSRFGSYINLKLNENNYCTLIIKDAKQNENLNMYLSQKSLDKENKSIS